MIKSFPVIRKLVKDDAFGEKSKSRAIVGTMAQIFMLAWEFIRKFMYVILLIYVPYTILAYFFPLIRIHQDISIIYLFIIAIISPTGLAHAVTKHNISALNTGSPSIISVIIREAMHNKREF